MTSPPPILDTFVQRLAARNFEGLASCLDPGVRLRAILPPRLEEHHDRDTAAGRFRDWFADATSFKLSEYRIEPFADRWLVIYRIALDEGEGPHLVEQRHVWLCGACTKPRGIGEDRLADGAKTVAFA